MHRSRHALSLALLAVATPLAAQNLDLDKTGGAIGGDVSAHVQGNPNEPFIVLFDFTEQQTPVPALGITLDISDRWAGSSFVLPGFFDDTDAQGRATASLTLPSDPGLGGLVISLQAVAGWGPFRVSNLVRVTPQLPGTFTDALNAPVAPVLGGGAVLESNGDVLLVGGSGPVAQRYSERLEEWQLAGASFGVGLLSQTTALADGRVLFTGGLDLATGQPTDAAAIYDPATQTTTTLTMGSARAGHGASLLGNGKVLITGGSQSFDLTNPLSLFTGILSSTEFFDPQTNSFSAGPNMLEARALHTSTTLTNGQALIAGGITLLPIVNLPTVSATAYRFNPNNNSFGLPAFFTGARFLHTATALDNGRVLLAGGITLDLTTFLQTGNILDIVFGTRDDCQLFSTGPFGFGTFATVNGLQQGRAGAAIAPLPGGGALVAGGFELRIDIQNQQFVFEPTASADVFTQNPNTLTPTGSMSAPRAFPVTVNLADGTILVVGGGLPNAELYQR
ncbi:MAG: kelch repeat-containing protein [bacterium]|nr:kelch repeat-containing protein [bacterium]